MYRDDRVRANGDAPYMLVGELVPWAWYIRSNQLPISGRRPGIEAQMMATEASMGPQITTMLSVCGVSGWVGTRGNED